MTMTLRELVKEHDADSLHSYLLAHPRIWAAGLKDGPLVARMLDQLFRDERADLRQSAHRGMAALTGDTPEDKANRMAGQKRLTDRMEKTLLDWPTFAGVPLRDCTRSTLLASVAARRDQAGRQELAAGFEEAVARLLPNKRATVGRALTAEAISEAYQGVYSEAA